MRLSIPLLVFTAVALLGCASSEATQNISRSEIGVQEIQDSSARTVLGLIQQHRPSWFRQSDRDYSSYARGTRKIGLVVYIDGQRYGEGSSALSSISAFRVHLIEHLRADEALSQHGIGHEEGAIHVTTHYQAEEDEEENEEDGADENND